MSDQVETIPHDYKDGMTLVWPEPQNEDFRKNTFLAYFDLMRRYSYDAAQGLMTALFGQNYKEEAANYTNKATESEINEMIALAWEEYGQPQLQDEVFLRSMSMGYGWSALMSTIARTVKHNAVNANYDNLNDFVRLVGVFCDGKKVEAEKLARQQIEREKDAEQKQKRSDPNYKEVPADIQKKFEEMGMEIHYNTKPASFGTNRQNSAYYEPYERIFVKDEAGMGGKLHHAKERIKKLFAAQYAKTWTERLGRWWHVPATTDLNQLYEVIAG